MRIYLSALFLVLLFCANAQTITGFVVNEDNEPVIGAQVMEAGSRNGTTSNIDGSFILTLNNPEASLIFSFIGYAKDSIKLEEGKLHQVVLKKQSAAKDSWNIQSYLGNYKVWLIIVWAVICIWLVIRTFRGVPSA